MIPKQLHFDSSLVPLVLSGVKTCTWRVFDKKGLQALDALELLWSSTNKKFADATVLSVSEKRFGDLGEEDLVGHEKFVSRSEMFRTYNKYYQGRVTDDVMVKVVRFRIERFYE